MRSVGNITVTVVWTIAVDRKDEFVSDDSADALSIGFLFCFIGGGYVIQEIEGEEGRG